MAAKADPARAAVLQGLADAIERFVKREAEQRASNNLAGAEETHRYLDWVQRAYRAEYSNPEPRNWWRK